MHILLVTTSYPESQSGSEAAGGFVEAFARELGRHARVSVVAATGGASSARDEGPLRVRRFAVKRWPLSLLRPFDPRDWGAIVAALRAGGKALRDAIAERRPDYILALWALPSGAWAWRSGIPYGTWALGSDVWSLGRIPVLRAYLRRVLRGARHRFADGLQLGRDVEAIGGLSCEFLPSARRLDVQRPTAAGEAPPYRLAFLGRWHRNKGVDLFLEALALLAPDDWTRIDEVRIHGGGPLEPDVRRIAGRLRDQGRPVKVGGYLDTDGAAGLIGWCDYLVLPSRVESIPVVFSDAAQLRRPLIATPVGDLPDLFARHPFGVLASEVSVSALVDALRQGLRGTASQFHAQLESLSQEFDVAVVAQQFVRRLEAEGYGQ